MESFLEREKRLKTKERQTRMYEVAAKIALKYGSPGRLGYEEDYITEFWHYDNDPPVPEAFRRHIRVKDVKKVIQTSLVINHDIWNADFMNGMSRNGTLRDKSGEYYKSLYWRSNPNINKIISLSPFGGRTGKNFDSKESYNTKVWGLVPAFDLSYEENTTSFVAGLLSVGKIVKWRGNHFVKYRNSAIGAIKNLKIPIEKEIHGSKFGKPDHYILISLIWGAIFSRKMPKDFRGRWLNIKDAYNAELYSAILWRTYVSNSFRPAGIPYLKSRRMIYYRYKCEEGAMTKLENLRFEMGLSQLDYSIRDIVKDWANNPV